MRVRIVSMMSRWLLGSWFVGTKNKESVSWEVRGRARVIIASIRSFRLAVEVEAQIAAILLPGLLLMLMTYASSTGLTGRENHSGRRNPPGPGAGRVISIHLRYTS